MVRQMGNYLNLLISHSSSSLPNVSPAHPPQAPSHKHPTYPLAHSGADAGQVLESTEGKAFADQIGWDEAVVGALMSGVFTQGRGVRHLVFGELMLIIPEGHSGQ